MAVSTLTLTLRLRWWFLPLVKAVCFACVLVAKATRGRLLIVPDRLLGLLVRFGTRLK